MSNHSVIEHRACYHFVKAEEDYIAVCSSGKCSPHCKALILAVLESWANTKGKDEYIYMSLPQWITATYMFYERNVIFDSLKELLDEGLIERQSIVKFGQKTFEYRLGIKKVQELVKALPEKVSEHLPNLDNYIAFKTRAKEGRPKKAVDKSTTSKSKSKKSPAVDKSTTSPLINQSPAVDKSTDMPLINQRNLDSNTIDSNLDSNLDSFIATAHADVNAPTQSFSQTSLLGEPEQVETKLKKEKAPAKEKKADTSKPATEKKPRKTAAVSGEETTLRRQVHDWVNKRRGYSLQGRASAGAVIQENLSCTTLANLLYRGIHQNDPEGCTWDDLDREWDYIAKHDKFWKLSENKDRIGAQAILQMHAQTMPKVRQSNISVKGTTTTPSETMTHNEACSVAQDAIEKGKQHRYSIDAKVYSSGNGWLVNVVWDGQALVPIESKAMWNKEFEDNHKFEQELLQQARKKGSR